MKKKLKKLSLSRDTVTVLSSEQPRVVGGAQSFLIAWMQRTPLQPSSEAGYSDQSVCPSLCASDCYSGCYCGGC